MDVAFALLRRTIYCRYRNAAHAATNTVSVSHQTHVTLLRCSKIMQSSRLAILYTLLRLGSAINTTVTTGCNVHAGVSLPNGISQWLGIRYAAAPVGDLRFAAPQDPPCNSSVQAATAVSENHLS
jgi:hypothetical protein